MVDEAGSFFQDETKLETNPKVGLCWMRKGEAEAPAHPRHQPQGVDFRRAQLQDGTFPLGLEGSAGMTSFSSSCSNKLQENLPLPQSQLHLAVDNDGSHVSKRVERDTWMTPGVRIRLHPLPSWSPESNPVELVWWSLHEAVSRNHECAGLDGLVEFAEGLFSKRGNRSGPKLGEVYDQLGEAAALEIERCPFSSWSYLGRSRLLVWQRRLRVSWPRHTSSGRSACTLQLFMRHLRGLKSADNTRMEITTAKVDGWPVKV